MTTKSDIAAQLANGWTLETLQVHWDYMRAADERFNEERDRRYSEVNTEREKALKIKEEADKAALGLAREIQSYKDEKANQLREQISEERGTYASKADLSAAVREINATLAPLTSFASSQRGEQTGSAASVSRMLSIIAGLTGISTIISTIIGVTVLLRAIGH